MVLMGAVYGDVSDEIGLGEAPGRGDGMLDLFTGHLNRADAARLTLIYGQLAAEDQTRLLDVLSRIDPDKMDDLVDVLDALDPQERQDLLELVQQVARERSLDGLSDAELQRLEELGAVLGAKGIDLEAMLDGVVWTGLPGRPGGPPLDAVSAGGLTGEEAGPRPGPVGRASFAPDREGSGNPTCYAVFEPYYGCAKRWEVLDQMGPDYVMRSDAISWSPAPLGAGAATAVGAFEVTVEFGRVTSIYSLAPDQTVVSFSYEGPGDLTLVRDGRGVFGVQGDQGTFDITIGIRDDSGYRDGIPAQTRAQIPAFIPDPKLTDQVRPWLQQHGYWDRDDLGAALAELQTRFQGFDGGAPLSAAQQPDFFLSVVQAEQGCCRHFAVAYVAAAQVMGVEARMVYNEGHAFAEVRMADGWVEVQLGGCSGYSLRDAAGRSPSPDVVATHDRLDARPGGAQGNLQRRETTTAIVDAPSVVGKAQPFIVSGQVTANGAGVGGGRVSLYLSQNSNIPGTFIGRTDAGPDGAWAIGAQAPGALPAGEHQLVVRHAGVRSGDVYYASSSGTMGVTVHAASRLLPAVPAYVATQEDVRFAVYLKDDRVGIQGERVYAELEGLTYTATTGRDGRASFEIAGVPRGEYHISFRFEGQPYLSASSAAATFHAVDARFVPDLDEPVRVVADQAWTMEGQILSGGHPVPGLQVTVTAWGQKVATTDGDGRLSMAWTPTAGRTMVALEATIGAIGGFEVWAQRPATLELVSPYAPGGIATVQVVGQTEGAMALQTDAGTAWTDAEGRAEVPVIGGRVKVRLSETEAMAGSVLDAPVLTAPLSGQGALTDGRLVVAIAAQGLNAPAAPVLHLDGREVVGEWRGDTAHFNVAGLAPEGTLVMRTGFPDDAMQFSYVSVAAPGRDIPWPWVAGGVLVAAALAASAWLYRSGAWRRWRIEPTLVIAAQGRRAGVPVAADVGEPLSIQVRCVDPRTGEPVTGRLRWRLGRQRGHAAFTDTGTTITTRSLEAGAYTLVLRVRARGVGRCRRVVEVHIGPWEEHLTRSYEALRAEAERRADSTGLTPHMVLRALPDRYPPRLAEAIRMYEEAAFGQRRIGEADWTLFATAALPEAHAR